MNDGSWFEDESWPEVARRGAEEGNADAQCSLGSMYRIGFEVSQDDAEAAKWFRKAADQDHADAQLFLAQMSESGEGLPCDLGTATEWYRRAAEQANLHAVGWLLLHGRQDLLHERFRISGMDGPPPAILRGTRISTIGPTFYGLSTIRFRRLLGRSGARVLKSICKETDLVVVADNTPPSSLKRAVLFSPDRPFVKPFSFLAMYFDELAPLEVKSGCTFKQHLDLAERSEESLPEGGPDMGVPSAD